jgi:hypothetical protein
MEGGNRVSFDLDGVLQFLNGTLDVLLALFRPLLHFVKTVSEESWLGLALVFLIFFTLFLIRMGARSGQGFGVYAEALEYVGRRGLLASCAVLVLLLLEWLLMPPLAVLLSALGNSLFGGEPGLRQLLRFLSTATPERSAFLGDMREVYRNGQSLLPLGWRAATLVAVAFGSMLLVGKAGARYRSTSPF